MKKEIIRQGDILLVPTSKKYEFNAKGMATLAFGEVSGHSHRIQNASFVRGENGLAQALVLEELQELVHEEHDTKIIPAKQLYEIRVQRRVSALGEVRKVMD